jgi:DNA modification methylase
MIEAEKPPKSCIVWDKKVRIQNLDKFYKQHEFIAYYGPFGGQKTVAGDVWRVDREVSSDHPTAKPVALIEQALEYASMPKQIIQDLFGDSGSTLIACEKTRRRCFMMELSPAYVDVIRIRWELATGKKAVLSV